MCTIKIPWVSISSKSSILGNPTTFLLSTLFHLAPPSFQIFSTILNLWPSQLTPTIPSFSWWPISCFIQKQKLSDRNFSYLLYRTYDDSFCCSISCYPSSRFSWTVYSQCLLSSIYIYSDTLSESFPRFLNRFSPLPLTRIKNKTITPSPTSFSSLLYLAFSPFIVKLLQRIVYTPCLQFLSFPHSLDYLI